MKFKTQFDKHDRFFTEAGSPVKIKYGLIYEKDGKPKIIEKGKISLYNEIQSHAESVDIHVTLKRFASGDVDVLNQRNGAFGDFSDLPVSFADMLNTVNNATETFKSLPVEIRANFNHNVSEFIAALDDPATFNAKMQVKTVDKQPEEAYYVDTADNSKE